MITAWHWGGRLSHKCYEVHRSRKGGVAQPNDLLARLQLAFVFTRHSQNYYFINIYIDIDYNIDFKTNIDYNIGYNVGKNILLAPRTFLESASGRPEIKF